MDKEIIQTVPGFVTALRGPRDRQADVASRLGLSVQSLSNAKSSNRLPPEKFLLHQAEAKKHGVSVNPAIWFGDNVPEDVVDSMSEASDV